MHFGRLKKSEMIPMLVKYNLDQIKEIMKRDIAFVSSNGHAGFNLNAESPCCTAQMTPFLSHFCRRCPASEAAAQDCRLHCFRNAIYPMLVPSLQQAHASIHPPNSHAYLELLSIFPPPLLRRFSTPFIYCPSMRCT